jgi:hypothetical protein
MTELIHAAGLAGLTVSSFGIALLVQWILLRGFFRILMQPQRAKAYDARELTTTLRH